MLNLGMGIGWTSPVVVKLRDTNQTILAQPITEEEGAWLVSIDALGGLLFTLVAGWLIDTLGRKRCMILANVPRIAVCLLYIFATDFWMLFLARGICGVCEVISLSVIPTYASEIASKDIRGALGTVTQIMSSIGMLTMLCVGPFVSYLTLNIIYGGISCLPLIAQLFLPETPYFLYKKGYTEDSLKVLTSIRKSEEIAHDEMKEYALNSNASCDKMEFLKDRTVLKSIVKGVFLSIGFQVIGYNSVTAYLQTIFESTRTSLSPEIASTVIGCIQLLACINTIFLTDRYGRKPILTVTLLGMALGMIGLGVFYKLTDGNEMITGVLNFLPLVSIILIIYCFNAGMGSIMWMLIAELFDGPSRAVGLSFSVFSSTVSIFLVTKYFSSIVNTIGPAATYWVFSGNCIVTCLFIMFFIPETKGRGFSEIQKDLGRNYSKSESPT